MPAKPAWLLRIPDILDDLRSLSAPVVDRSMCEGLFGIRRRRAIILMQELGACQFGRTLLLERTAMIRKLEALQEGQEFERERTRRQKLRAGLDDLHRHRAAANVRIPVLAPELRKHLPDLPAGVLIRGRELTIEYTNVEQLLQRLYELSLTAAADFEAFATIVDEPPGAGPSITLIPA